jgi:hypothetical protein
MVIQYHFYALTAMINILVLNLITTTKTCEPLNIHLPIVLQVTWLEQMKSGQSLKHLVNLLGIYEYY